MPFYLGENQYKVYLNGQKYRFANRQIEIDIPKHALISSDNFYLKDKNGVYLTALPRILSLYAVNDQQLIEANNEILLVEE